MRVYLNCCRSCFIQRTICSFFYNYSLRFFFMAQSYCKLLFLIIKCSFSLFRFIYSRIFFLSLYSLYFIYLTFYCLALSYSFSAACLLLLSACAWKRFNLLRVVIRDNLYIASIDFAQFVQILANLFSDRLVSSIFACKLERFWSYSWKFRALDASSMRRILYRIPVIPSIYYQKCTLVILKRSKKKEQNQNQMLRYGINCNNIRNTKVFLQNIDKENDDYFIFKA